MRVKKLGEMPAKGSNREHGMLVCDTLDIYERNGFTAPGFIWDLEKMLDNQPWRVLTVDQLRAVVDSREKLLSDLRHSLERTAISAYIIEDTIYELEIEGLRFPLYNV